MDEIEYLIKAYSNENYVCKISRNNQDIGKGIFL